MTPSSPRYASSPPPYPQAGDASGTGVFDTAGRTWDAARCAAIDARLLGMLPRLVRDFEGGRGPEGFGGGGGGAFRFPSPALAWSPAPIRASAAFNVDWGGDKGGGAQT